MRIALYSGGTLYPLAGQSGVSERDHSSAAGFELTPESAVQVAEFLRAEYAKPIDRGNLLNVVSFSTTRMFDTPAEAQLWCLDYHATFPSSGTLYFDAISPGGIISRRAMANTVVDPPRRRCIGATALLDYTARGGEITAVTIYPNLVVTGSLTSNGTTPAVFPTQIYAGEYNGRNYYSNTGTLIGVTHNIFWSLDDTAWVLEQVSPYAAWISTSDVTTPDLATGWTPVSPATGTPTVSEA